MAALRGSGYSWSSASSPRSPLARSWRRLWQLPRDRRRRDCARARSRGRTGRLCQPWSAGRVIARRPITSCNNLARTRPFPLPPDSSSTRPSSRPSQRRPPGLLPLVFAAFVLALALNFLATRRDTRAGWTACRSHDKVRDVVDPGALRRSCSPRCSRWPPSTSPIGLGTTGFTLFGLVLVIFQYLVGELLTSKRRSDKLQRIATTDELTGLANREQFHAMIARADRRRPARRTASFAVLLMDLDRFKEINDTLGHHYGDVLLKDLGPRLTAAIGEGGFVARLGGDEFGILLAEDTDDIAVLDVVDDAAVQAASASRSRSTSCRSRSGPASAWPASRRTARTPTRCCAAPTSRCTRPRRPRPSTRSTPPSRTSTPSAG